MRMVTHSAIEVHHFFFSCRLLGLINSSILLQKTKVNLGKKKCYYMIPGEQPLIA